MSPRVLHYLSKYKGISLFQASRICQSLGISPLTRVNELPPYLAESLDFKLADIKKNTNSSSGLIEQNLQKFNRDNINRLILIQSLRGKRLAAGFPARGQRTRSNARTAKLKLHSRFS